MNVSSANMSSVKGLIEEAKELNYEMPTELQVYIKLHQEKLRKERAIEREHEKQ